jgi:hypothetical protein
MGDVGCREVRNNNRGLLIPQSWQIWKVSTWTSQHLITHSLLLHEIVPNIIIFYSILTYLYI